MTWHIVRVSHGKEHDVEAGLRRLTVEVRTWILELMVVIRPRQRAGRTKPPRRAFRLPLPGSVFARLDPSITEAVQHIDGFEGMWRDVHGCADPIRDLEMEQFMAEVHRYNSAMEAYYNRLMSPKPKRRPERFKGFDGLAAALQAKQECQDSSCQPQDVVLAGIVDRSG